MNLMTKLVANRQLITTLLLLFSAVIPAGCHKVPLRENWGSFNLLAAHWFENEKTQYVFFSVENLRKEHASTDYASRFEIALDGETGASNLAPKSENGFSALDMTKAVHLHSVKECGEGRVCGSYSFSSDRPVSGLRMRFRYHQDSPLFIEQTAANSVHLDGLGSDAQSALVYGVFSKDNSRVQIRVHDNFGTPNSEQIQMFGMRRAFDISSLRLSEITIEKQGELRTASGSPFLFPATACDGNLHASEMNNAPPYRFSGSEAWLPSLLEPTTTLGSACSQIRFLSKNGEALRTTSVLARRNPVFKSEAVLINAPLRNARRIPLVLSYCAGRPGSTSLVSELFLQYQRFILGIGKAEVDTCFAVGEEARFQEELRRSIVTKLNDARASNVDGSDFIFIVAINHRLGSLVPRFHQIILQELQAKQAEESARISPRLVGSFVYDSTPPEAMGIKMTPPGIVWCPRLPMTAAGAPDSDHPQNSNCVAGGSGEVDLKLVNFLVPMGPFPTLDTYVSHVQRYGDRGTSRNPELVIQSVQTNANSVTKTGVTVTFFDGERVSVRATEGIRLCRVRDNDGLLNSVMFKFQSLSGSDSGPSGDSEVQTSQNIEPALLNPSEDRSFHLGLSWEHPYWGGVSFESPIDGKALSIIPISTTVAGHQKVGDEKWQRQTWNVGRLMQKCVLYCDHPIFDEAGVYQLNETWRSLAFGQCPTPRPPEPQD